MAISTSEFGVLVEGFTFHQHPKKISPVLGQGGGVLQTVVYQKTIGCNPEAASHRLVVFKLLPESTCRTLPKKQVKK